MQATMEHSTPHTLAEIVSACNSHTREIIANDDTKEALDFLKALQMQEISLTTLIESNTVVDAALGGGGGASTASTQQTASHSTKRGPGRPPKQNQDTAAPKRGRGRPRKVNTEAETASV